MGMQLVTETAASASWSAGFFTARYDPPSSIRPIHSHNLPNIFFIFFLLFIFVFRLYVHGIATATAMTITFSHVSSCRFRHKLRLGVADPMPGMV